MSALKTQKNRRRSSKKAQPKPSYAAEYKKVAASFVYGFRVISNWHMLLSYVYVLSTDGADTDIKQIVQKYRAQKIKVPNAADILTATYDYNRVLKHYYGYFFNGYVCDGYGRGRKMTLKDLQQMHAEIKAQEQIYRDLLGFHNGPGETLDALLVEIDAQVKTKTREKELQQKLSVFSFESSPTASISTDALLFAASFNKPMSVPAKNKKSLCKPTKEKR